MKKLLILVLLTACGNFEDPKDKPAVSASTIKTMENLTTMENGCLVFDEKTKKVDCLKIKSPPVF